MKRYIFLTFTFCIAFYTMMQAQITITQSDAPIAGESWIDFIDDRFNVHTIGPAGANQSWDYSTNFVVQDTDYVNFVAPSSLWPPLNTYFPNSNLAFDDPIDSSVVYLKINSTGIYADGSYIYALSSPIDSINYDPDLLFLPLPFTYNDIRTHTSKFELVVYDSSLNATLKYKSFDISHFNCDGYGTLTIPSGTYSNVLRIRNLTERLDSTFIDTSGTGNFIFINTSGIDDTSISYQHVQNGTPAILFTLEVLADGMTVEEAYYSAVLPVGLNEPSQNVASFIYPNPVVDDEFRIRIEHEDAYSLKIYSVEGKQVYTTSVQQINDLKLQLNLSGGTYTYKILTKDGQSIESGKFVKVN